MSKQKLTEIFFVSFGFAIGFCFPATWVFRGLAPPTPEQFLTEDIEQKRIFHDTFARRIYQRTSSKLKISQLIGLNFPVLTVQI